MLEKLAKTSKNTLLNAIFIATESGASFAKKEISFIPYQSYKKVIDKGVERKIATDQYDGIVIFDINFQKQQLLKLDNCKRFYTSEVHEGVKIIEDLTTGRMVFEGDNDVTKPTIGYYAVFVTTEGEVYDKFMSNAEIIERAKFSPQFKADNYKNPNNNIHFEKVVVRNLIKEIPKFSNNLKSIVAFDEAGEFVDFQDVTNQDAIAESEPKKVNKLEEGKAKINNVKDEEPAKPEQSEQTDVDKFF